MADADSITVSSQYVDVTLKVLDKLREQLEDDASSLEYVRPYDGAGNGADAIAELAHAASEFAREAARLVGRTRDWAEEARDSFVIADEDLAKANATITNYLKFLDGPEPTICEVNKPDTSFGLGGTDSGDRMGVLGL